MENLSGILKLADAELGAITSNGKFRSRDEIHSAYELIDIAKDIYCIWDYEDGSDDVSYRYDGSYARGRRNAKRDSMGRYSREPRTYYGYARDGKDEYMEHLREMADDAPDEQTRQSIHRMIEQMK